MEAIELSEKIIKPKLQEIFGVIAGNSILQKARTASLNASSQSDKAKVIIDTVCNDPKVISIWGASGVRKQKDEWLRLI